MYVGCRLCRFFLKSILKRVVDVTNISYNTLPTDAMYSTRNSLHTYMPTYIQI